MNRDKQIEEMAFNLIMATSPLGVKDLTKQFDYKSVATDLYDLFGWRKASDVAREIMQEVRQALLNMVLKNAMGENYDIENRFAELEKKYTNE